MKTAKVKLEWKGAAQLQAMFEKTALQLDDKDPRVKEILLGPCERAVERARELSPPPKTGLLRKSIYASPGGKRQRGIWMGIKGDAYYGRFIEKGTSKLVARPFFFPAMMQLNETMVAEIAPGIKALIEETAAKNAYKPPH